MNQHLFNLENKLSEWRNRDQEDSIVLSRSDVILLLDGIEHYRWRDRDI